jgi:hypothetical protein
MAEEDGKSLFGWGGAGVNRWGGTVHWIGHKAERCGREHSAPAGWRVASKNNTCK